MELEILKGHIGELKANETNGVNIIAMRAWKKCQNFGNQYKRIYNKRF